MKHRYERKLEIIEKEKRVTKNVGRKNETRDKKKEKKKSNNEYDTRTKPL